VLNNRRGGLAAQQRATEARDRKSNRRLIASAWFALAAQVDCLDLGRDHARHNDNKK
jgi:hypothetical protein